MTVRKTEGDRPAIELHGAQTGNCIRVAIALEELGVAYRTIMVDLWHGAHRETAHLLLNPAGKVPTLVDHSVSTNPFVLSQSNAILFYLAERYPGGLLPTVDAWARGHALERFFYFLTDVIGPNMAAFQLRRRGSHGGAAILDQQVLTALKFAEIFVEEGGYMAGNDFSLADIAAVTAVIGAESEVEWQDVPRLGEWFNRVRNRPSVIRGTQAFAVAKG